MRGAVRWLSDWAERTDLQPWMLYNLVLALRYGGSDRLALAVTRRALTLCPDHTSSYHVLWLAFEALAGQTHSDVKTIGGLDRQKLDAIGKMLCTFVDALILVQQADPAARGDAFRRARALLCEAAVLQHQLSSVDRRVLGRAYRRCVRRLAKDDGSWKAWCWSFWRQWVSPSLRATH
jgi:hypothetical protein